MLMEAEGLLQRKFDGVLKHIEAVPKEDLALVMVVNLSMALGSCCCVPFFALDRILMS